MISISQEIRIVFPGICTGYLAGLYSKHCSLTDKSLGIIK